MYKRYSKKYGNRNKRGIKKMESKGKMGKISNRKTIIQNKIKKNKKYKVKEAIEKFKEISVVNFCETVEIVIKLGKYGRNVKQVKKNKLYLPYRLENNKKKIVVLQTNETNKIKNKEKILKLGVDIIGVDEIKKNKKINYILCESESAKQIVEDKLKPKIVLIKKENLTKDILKKVKEIKKGKLNYCVDKNGIINTVLGQINFTFKQIKKNFNVLIKDVLNKNTVGNIKDIKNIYLSTTMGPGLRVDKSEIRRIEDLKI
ncbi:ribosomal protein L1 [Candidatus Portiera aleyrodidarum]|uniref:Large ribosomal subunit protein uL1 n=1 Tax=Candidatus Portiera aleyrodidarum TaxID=91844 RepID=A0A6S6RYG8_9GAMM|nr:50S ribosomal protein L1 [Candidatus Portiera aleyrodidarum]CAA3705592.1 ribosomal protein L1 [Candidatus Portiera aleyrodidarum]